MQQRCVRCCDIRGMIGREEYCGETSFQRDEGRWDLNAGDSEQGGGHGENSLGIHKRPLICLR